MEVVDHCRIASRGRKATRGPQSRFGRAILRLCVVALCAGICSCNARDPIAGDSSVTRIAIGDSRTLVIQKIGEIPYALVGGTAIDPETGVVVDNEGGIWKVTRSAASIEMKLDLTQIRSWGIRDLNVNWATGSSVLLVSEPAGGHAARLVSFAGSSGNFLESRLPHVKPSSILALNQDLVVVGVIDSASLDAAVLVLDRELHQEAMRIQFSNRFDSPTGQCDDIHRMAANSLTSSILLSTGNGSASQIRVVQKSREVLKQAWLKVVGEYATDLAWDVDGNVVALTTAGVKDCTLHCLRESDGEEVLKIDLPQRGYRYLVGQDKAGFVVANGKGDLACISRESGLVSEIHANELVGTAFLSRSNDSFMTILVTRQEPPVALRILLTTE